MVFGESLDLFPEAARSKCRDVFFNKYYAFAMVFLQDISPTVYSVGTEAVCGGSNIGININHGKGNPCASRSVAKTGLLVLFHFLS